MHITFIQQARQFETSVKNKYMHTEEKESSKIIRKRPILSAQKKQLDKNFISISSDSEDTSSDNDQDETENIKSSEEPRVCPYPSASVEMMPLGLKAEVELDENFISISERTTSFSSANGEFCGKHTRFISSDSEDPNSDVNQDETGNIKNSERPSICPYPSTSEEMMLLGLEYSKDIRQSESTFLTLLDKIKREIEQSKRKRKLDYIQSPMASNKVVKRKVVQTKPFTSRKGTKNSQLGNQDSNDSSDFPQGNDSIKMFVNTWKEACRTNDIDEVLERMLQFYTVKKKAEVTAMFSSFPFCGLLQVAVTSIKHGMLDSLNNNPQTFNQCVTVGDIIGKISTYFEGDDDAWSTASSYHEKFLFLLNKFCKLESWLTEQFSVKQFESLGYGDIWSFLEKNMHLFSHTLSRCLTGDMHENTSLVPSMLDYQFDLLLSQASQCLWETEKVGKRRISDLLMRQFPLVCLKVAGSDLMMGVEGFMKIHKGDMTLKSVVFSETLLKEDVVGRFHKNMLEKMGLENGEGHGACIVMSKEAMKVLLNAPMLIDLNLWSHWDVVFAPSLGSLVGWLLNEVSTKELLYLVTACGKVFRVDHSATVDSFLNVLLQGNPFDTAVKLLSLLVLYGGEKRVPLSLLKCHARHAFEVLIEQYEEIKSQNPLKHTKFLHRQVINDRSTFTKSSKVLRSDRMDSAVSFVSRFVLDCLGYLPVEFYCFAADILLAGLQPFVKDAPSAILGECEHFEQRLMLHRVGMLLGIMDWVDDKQKLSSSSASSLLMSSGSSCLGVTELDLSIDSTIMHVLSNKYPLSRSRISLSPDPMRQNENQEACCSAIVTDVPLDDLAGYAKMPSCELECSGARVIESIQQEEFGLQPDQSLVESALLKKQHARLGRALHCLSQELYSQDSHFILELVQNADDNTYPETVEPSLTFILQDKAIIVLNNERGFSADDIRALCDVGNSTKKGRNAGYIGKKGIGFKSVFRVTDAPEIHSNGFHIKFDITNGQIGFVLPTVVPPCDIDFYTRLASSDSDCNHWKTCILLPLRSTLLERSSGKNIISMFADLHPSLLLFLHRLHCIKFRNMLSESIIVMRKEVVGNGIIKVSFGEEKMTCYVVSQKLRADTIRPDTPTTEISIAFTLQETIDGCYNPHLDQQPVFSFLPLRKYGLKFILQGDFVLPSSREGVDGDSPWNQWLLSEFPSLFVSAERSFCDLPCFRDNPAKGVAAYMSFVPLVGDVHGFFSGLPRMILSRLRTSNCLLLEGTENEWVAPCRVLSNWTEESRKLLPDSLLCKHLGLGFLHKDIILPDLLAMALGIEKYGLKVLFQVMTSLCSSEDGLKSMGLGWLCEWLNTVYTLLLNSESSAGFRSATDLMNDLWKIPFIPLSDGKYGSLDEGVIWLHLDPLGPTIDDKYAAETFPRLFASLRTVSSALLSAAAALGTSHCESSILDNVTRILYRAGVQPLSAHQIAKKHIVPSLYREQNGRSHREIMTEDLAFFMFHLQSSCPDCQSEKEQIIREVHDNAFCQCDSCICQCPELHSNSLFFAFLPLRKYGLKYKLHGDFVVPSSRDEITSDSAWNQWLLSEFPGLFASTQRSFCDLPCFRNNPAKGVTAYMSFVPVVGEGHGCFSSLPQMVLSTLCMSNCLILEGTETEWVAPCKVLRNWTEESRNLLPDSLLRKHLGVGFLHRDIVLSDLLARALGIMEYGLKALIQVITSLCSSEDGLKLMGLGWLSAWLNAVYALLSNGKDLAGFETESDLMKGLQKIPFIPLSDGNYGSLDEGAIWLQFDPMGTTIDGDYVPETFPRLHASLRTVSPALLSAAATLGTSNCESSEVDNVIKMLYRAGVQRLSTHEIVNKHILPSLYSEKNGEGCRHLMTEYVAFLMFHLQSSCRNCKSEKEQIIREIRDNAFCQCDSCICHCPELHINSLFFAFLPLRKYGLKYKLQGDFVLPSSRDEVDGDSAQNEWLFSEFPGLFVSAERSFCMPCPRDNPAKGITAYMSFVPLVGEDHGFFSSLPQMILSKLRMSNCLIVEGMENEWVAPCKVLRSWTEESRKLLPDSLLRSHLGVGFLHKDIVLPDLLARALGVEEYGLKVLFQVMSSLCSSEDGLKSMGLRWLSSWLNTVYTLLTNGQEQDLAGFGTELDLVKDLRKIPFIPLSDGKYGSLDEGVIWLHFDSTRTTIDGDYAPETFPRLHASLRTVSSALLSAAAAFGTSYSESSIADNVMRMLYRAGVQRLSAHQIVKKHILPSLNQVQNGGQRDMMPEYVAFLMFHLQSSCPDCQLEKEQIISEVRGSAFCHCDSCVCQCPELHSNSLYFAFLPLRKYGLKYKLQGDFVLPSSRDEANGNYAWNQWLLSEFPGLFVSSERSFCNMPGFRDNLAKGVTTYMSFVPLVGKGHGFFSSLPQMILSRLRMSNCLIVEGAGTEWVAPCKVLRNWTEESRKLLPDSLLRKHLGVGFMHKDIILPDSLARVLGVEEYGLKVLLQVITSLCSSKDGLRSMGLGWLSSWLNTVYTLLSVGKDLAGFGTESDLMKDLRKIPFIPLSDGKYGSLDEGAVWLHFHSLGTTINDVYAPETFPRLYASVRTVSSALLSAAAALGTSCCGSSVVDNVSMMLYRVGVQQLSAHQIVKIHILPYLYREQNEQEHKEIMTEYLAFLMFHLQSSCCDCQLEKEQIIRELRDNVFILTNHGCRRPVEVPIHFSKEYRNPIDMRRLIQGLDLTWHEIEDMYLKHPINRMLSGGVLKWRKFFQEMGIGDFVQVREVEKSMSDVCPLPMNVTWDKDLIPIGSIAKDWVSEEFVNMLLQLSSIRDTEKCKYLLEVLDRLWDDYFSDKVTGFYFTSNGERKIFDSAFSRILCDIRWIASTLDNELHCPRELFHDCEAVRSIFGDNVPYTVPKVRSERLITALGLKTQVTVDDTLAILKVWRAKALLRASVSQMSRFYTFMWNRMNTSERKVVEELCDGPCVFVPCQFGASLEDAVPGVLLSLKEVFWCDSTGSVDQVKMVNTKFVQQHPVTRILCSLYPGLHDFFVNRCGVDELPHFHGYLQILLHLSAGALPSQEAKKVFHIFLKWADELKSGSLRFEDVDFLEKSLKEKQYLILPTAKNKWVSLNQSFGIICWCDDDELRTEFEHFDNINFLYFGKLNDEEKEILRTKVSIFLRRLNIPSLSEVVTREIIYDGPTDTCFIASMVNWALPYAQRYIYNIYTDKYSQLSQSVFENLRCLQIVVVEKLFHKNVIKSVHIESEKQFECSCLLEGNILYATRESDSHSIFMEISRLFHSRAPDLHLANFLHMITAMAKSGSTEEQIEFFILNSQKMPKLPVGESAWSLANIPLSTDSVTWLMTSCAPKTIGETNTLNFKQKPGGSSNCSPRKTDHGVHDSYASAMKTQAASSIQPRKEETIEEIIETSAQAPTQITCVRNDPIAPVDYKTNDSFHASRASASKRQAVGGILSSKEETVEEVIAETSVLTPTEITCGRNHPTSRADWKSDHGFCGSCASVMKTQAARCIEPRREETIEEVIEETSALTPTQIICVRNDPVPTNGKTDHGFYGSHASHMKTQADSDIQPRKEETVEGVMAETSAPAPTEITCGHNDPAPTADGKTGHGFCDSHASVMKTQEASDIQPRKEGTVEEVIAETSVLASTEISQGRNDPASAAAFLGSRDTDHVCNVLVTSTINAASGAPYNVTAPQNLNYSSFDIKERGQSSIGMGYPQQALLTGRFSGHVHNVLVPSTVNPAINNVTAQQDLSYNSFDTRERVQFSFGMVDPQQALLTGRLGESAAFNYFVGKFGKPFVKWVNETYETGLPYDLLVAGNEYIEVKATRSVTKDWFHITLREWQFALEKGELFSIAHVVLSPYNAATVTVYKNPARLCCHGKLQLALIIPK
ncbi:protein NO VEIN-like isoform X2 [Solanum dulcamara]|nr:protein NO VEIN-like isoform X2 [Solanum dulcamara]